MNRLRHGLVVACLAALLPVRDTIPAEIRYTIPASVEQHQAPWRDRVPPQRPVPPFEEWFPLGVYAGYQGIEGTLEFMFDDLKTHHCNTLYVNSGPTKVEDVEALLDMAERADIRVYLQGSTLPTWPAWRRTRGEEALTAETDRAIAAARELMPRFRDRWGLLCWGLDEEIHEAHVPHAVRYLREAAELDPTHPAVILHNKPQVAARQYKQLAPAAVITDIYPYAFGYWGHKNPLAFMRRRLNQYHAFAREHDAPLWVVPQSFCEWPVWEPEKEIPYRGGYAMPSPPEITAQGWLCLAQGAKGLLFFMYQYHTDTLYLGLRTATWGETIQWRMIGRLFASIAPHTPLLVKLERLDEPVTKATHPAIVLGSFRHRDVYYLIAANINVNEPVEFSLRQTDAMQGRRIYNLHTGSPAPEPLRLHPGEGAIYLLGTNDEWAQYREEFAPAGS